ncbi:hypothetical protein [Marinomonas aquiplantarum]|uniref:hypothetical protein n=1 Tax=Marinomonas aquiplantarum TaxID=491951 RepID=UPI0015F0173E|nr:hypothetical protein [Marinomonas aquiplantarum]
MEVSNILLPLLKLGAKRALLTECMVSRQIIMAKYQDIANAMKKENWWVVLDSNQ